MTQDSEWQPGVVFTHTLSLTLNDESQQVLRDARNRLMAAGVPVLHEPAHITVAAVSTMDGIDSDLVDVGWPERVTLTTSCRLPNSDGVVALCPHDPTRRSHDPTRPGVAVKPAASDPMTISDTSRGGGVESCSSLSPDDVFRTSEALDVLCRPHEVLHRRLAEVGVTTFNYYGPRWWNPHVTMGYQVPPALQGRAVEILADVVPLEVGVMGISVWCVGDGHTQVLWSGPGGGNHHEE
ncbi:hypothetical protein O6R08_10615 [Cutibacterium equinum]|uniref:2'-5' RNA ligase n=1 Tax=Cutibacterium equinum TaxID=3016342 RepID=A0ABY7QXV4_9ACTN|nr:hypothetical protein [Cutibacterium equinum]WCC79881.1 hypothetical protein O6R08_10615 [Cutibacterium equinum]